MLSGPLTYWSLCLLLAAAASGSPRLGNQPCFAGPPRQLLRQRAGEGPAGTSSWACFAAVTTGFCGSM